jgi:hypothetical protein
MSQITAEGRSRLLVFAGRRNGVLVCVFSMLFGDTLT